MPRKGDQQHKSFAVIAALLLSPSLKTFADKESKRW